MQSAVQAVKALSEQDLRDRIAALMAENDALKAKGQGKLTPKVSEKGAVSLYGLGRFPVTLYGGQWERLIAYVKAGEMDKFLTANAGSLAKRA